MLTTLVLEEGEWTEVVVEAPVLDAYVTLDPSHLLQVPKDARHTTIDNIYTLYKKKSY